MRPGLRHRSAILTIFLDTQYLIFGGLTTSPDKHHLYDFTTVFDVRDEHDPVDIRIAGEGLGAEPLQLFSQPT